MARDIDIKTAIAQHIDHLKTTGRKKSTVNTTLRSLELLEADLGATKIVSKIMPMHIAVFFKSEPANIIISQDGPRPRAATSILQIRRNIRSALVWWTEQGYIDAVPLPKEERRFVKDASEVNKKKGVRKAAKKKGPTADTTAKEGPQELHSLSTEEPEPTTETITEAEANEPANEQPEEREYVDCPKTHARRDSLICKTNGCFSKAQAKRCPHWKRWMAEGKV